MVTDDSTGKLLGSLNIFGPQGENGYYKVPFTSRLSGRATFSLVSSLGPVLPIGKDTIVLEGMLVPYHTLEAISVVATFCSREWFLYGYNGQMKVNEVCGVGNLTTALHWEYGTREARRKNKDEWHNKPSISPYAVLDDNPILEERP
jgi:hypothetical protein